MPPQHAHTDAVSAVDPEDPFEILGAVEATLDEVLAASRPPQSLAFTLFRSFSYLLFILISLLSCLSLIMFVRIKSRPNSPPTTTMRALDDNTFQVPNTNEVSKDVLGPSIDPSYTLEAARLTALVESTGLDRRSSLKLVNSHLLNSPPSPPPPLPIPELITSLLITIYYSPPTLLCPPSFLLLILPSTNICLIYTCLLTTLTLPLLTGLHSLLSSLHLPSPFHHTLNIAALALASPSSAVTFIPCAVFVAVLASKVEHGWRR